MMALLSNNAANCGKLCVHFFFKKKHLLKGVRPIYCSSKGSQRHWHCGLSLNCSKGLYNAGRYCPKQQHVFCPKTNLSKGKSCTGLLRKKNSFGKQKPMRLSDFSCAISLCILLRKHVCCNSTTVLLRTMSCLCGRGHSISMPSRGFSQETLLDLSLLFCSSVYPLLLQRTKIDQVVHIKRKI